MSEFPKVFAWRSNPRDVLVFHSADEVLVDLLGYKWSADECECVARESDAWIRVPPNEQIAARIAYLRTELAVLEAIGPTACREDVNT